MFEAQEVSARPALVGVITDCSSLAFLTPSLWECSPLCGHLTTLTQAEEEKKLGRGRDRHQIPIVKMGDKLFYGSIIQIMSGPSVLLRANWNTRRAKLNIVRWFSQDFHSRHETHSHHAASPWPRLCHCMGQEAAGSQIASDDISLIF